MNRNFNIPHGGLGYEGPPHCENCGGTGQVPIQTIFDGEESTIVAMRTCPECGGDGVVNNNERTTE